MSRNYYARSKDAKSKDKELEQDVPNIKHNALEKLLECGICLRILKKPTTLQPCNHDFCRDCLQQYFFVNNICPTCRKGIQATIHSFRLESVLSWYHNENGYPSDNSFYQKITSLRANPSPDTIKIRHLEEEVDGYRHNANIMRINYEAARKEATKAQKQLEKYQKNLETENRVKQRNQDKIKTLTKEKKELEVELERLRRGSLIDRCHKRSSVVVHANKDNTEKEERPAGRSKLRKSAEIPPIDGPRTRRQHAMQLLARGEI